MYNSFNDFIINESFYKKTYLYIICYKIDTGCTVYFGVLIYIYIYLHVNCYIRLFYYYYYLFVKVFLEQAINHDQDCESLWARPESKRIV